MNIEQIMSKDLIVGMFNDSLKDISNLMLKYDVGFIPIAKEKTIIGVITDRDIVVNAICNEDNDCEVVNYITKNIIKINKDKSVEEAVNIMGEEKVKRLLVSDENNILVGIISFSDILTSEIDGGIIINNLKKICEITKNSDRMAPKVGEFKL